MSRVLPFKNPTWDYSLWEEVRSMASLITEKQVSSISRRDRGGSADSDSEFWTGDGRRLESGSDTQVIDFIGLSRSFDGWFTRVDLGRDGLIEEISSHISRINGGEHLQELGQEWTHINWAVLGRVIGSAIANEGNREGWWPYAGSDARVSNSFWGEMERGSSLGTGFRSVEASRWEEIVDFFRERGFDPSAELLRNASHRPSSPIIVYGDQYVMNPLTFRNRERMRELFRSHEDAEEFANFHGQLTFGGIRDAMDSLNQGNETNFAIQINGICSSHVMRSNLVQQKIGMHLFTNLAIRRMTRGVEAMNVPDIGHALATSFSLGKVLKILHKAGLIEWYTVDVSDVYETISDLQGR